MSLLDRVAAGFSRLSTAVLALNDKVENTLGTAPVTATKATPITGDKLLLLDSADGNAAKLIDWARVAEGHFTLLGLTPAMPVSDTVRLFPRKVAGRMYPAFIGPSGIDSALQPLLARNKVGYWNPPGNAATVPGVFGFTAPSVASFTATARNVATTNKFTRMRRLGYVTAATAAAIGHWRVGVLQFTTGGALGLGGFTYIKRFGISDTALVAGARMFAGMRTTASASNSEPSVLTNCIGLGHGAADTNMKLYFGGTTAQTPVDLGADFPIDANTTPYELAIFSPPGVATVFWEVTNLATGVAQAGQITGDATVMPQESLLLAPWAMRTNNATAAVVGLDIMSVYIETDY